LQSSRGKKYKFADSKLFIRVFEVQKLVAGGVSWLRSSDVHSSVHLKGVAVDDRCVEFFCEFFGKRRFSGRGGTKDCEKERADELSLLSIQF
jgi:hypothetical protein